jgi:hypothetical protein
MLEGSRLPLWLLCLEEGELGILLDLLHCPWVVLCVAANFHNILVHLISSVCDLPQPVILFTRHLGLLSLALVVNLRQALARGYGGDGRALGEDLVDLERLVALGNFFLDVCRADCVDGEKFVRGLFCNNTTAHCQNGLRVL